MVKILRGTVQMPTADNREGGSEAEVLSVASLCLGLIEFRRVTFCTAVRTTTFALYLKLSPKLLASLPFTSAAALHTPPTRPPNQLGDESNRLGHNRCASAEEIYLDQRRGRLFDLCSWGCYFAGCQAPAASSAG